MIKITDEQYEQMSNQIIIEFLKSASQKERYQLVSEWNHDAGYEVFKWIINDPETDKAIALMMYWQSGGECNKTYACREDLMQESPWDAERFDMIEQLEDKYMSGFYKNQLFVYDPTNDSHDYDWTKENWGELKREMPSEMLQRLDGVKVQFEEDWAEGVPPHVWEKISKLSRADKGRTRVRKANIIRLSSLKIKKTFSRIMKFIFPEGRCHYLLTNF